MSEASWNETILGYKQTDDALMSRGLYRYLMHDRCE